MIGAIKASCSKIAKIRCTMSRPVFLDGHGRNLILSFIIVWSKYFAQSDWLITHKYYVEFTFGKLIIIIKKVYQLYYIIKLHYI